MQFTLYRPLRSLNALKKRVTSKVSGSCMGSDEILNACHYYYYFFFLPRVCSLSMLFFMTWKLIHSKFKVNVVHVVCPEYRL